VFLRILMAVILVEAIILRQRAVIIPNLKPEIINSKLNWWYRRKKRVQQENYY